MQLSFDTEDEAFRASARAWLTANVPSERRPHSGPAARDFDLAWQHRQFIGGWAGVAWPVDYGGLGLSPVRQLIWLEEQGRAGAPVMGTLSVALAHAGPTLIALGTPEQKAFHLPRILRGEVIWCQGFSEPGAGSDLAGITTQGAIEGDEIVVTGQKIWTSHAQVADFQELLVRTDPGASRHAGLTWIICDMKAPGVTVRPIETMAGSHHYCEVFYDQVRLPLANVVGEVNRGWQSAMATLSLERGTGTIMARAAMARDVDDLMVLARTTPDPDTGAPLSSNPRIMQDLAMLKARVAGSRALTYKAISQAEAGVIGTDSALIGLYVAELAQKVQRFAVELLRHAELEDHPLAGRWHDKYLHSYCETIQGGTSEIRRNIIAQRILGLPK